MSAPAAPAAPLACPSCGTPTVPGGRFCFGCGSRLAPVEEADGAERRIVTVMFGDLSDFTAWAEDLDPERVGEVTDRVLGAMSSAVTDVGGYVDKLTGDGIMAVFGAPTAHEDDPERAVRAAAQMQASVRRLMEEEAGGGLQLGLRVGLNSGEVIARVQAHLAYTVVGDTVNTAARLSDAAGVGAVWSGRDTALATMGVASWRALPPRRLKGKRDPVEAFELVGLRPVGAARPGVGAEAPFVGRDAEFGVAAARLLDVIGAGSPASIVVTGDAGIGKTRLARELARFAGGLPGVRVLWGRARPYGLARDVAPFADWVRTAAGAADTDDPVEVAARVRRLAVRLGEAQGTAARLGEAQGTAARLGGLADALAPLFGSTVDGRVLPDPAAPGARSAGADPLVDALVRLLAALESSGPLLLVVDDLQSATAGLLAGLSSVTGRLGGRVLVVGLTRSDVFATSDWWRGLPAPELLPLLPLEEPAAERLLRGYLGGAELEADCRRALLHRAQGNPFFLAELLHLLVDRGLLQRAGTGWALTGELPAGVLPAGVRAVLAARIDDLDTAAKAVLRDASVVGTHVPLASLRAFHPGDPGLVRAAVGTLIDRGIVGPGRRDGTDREIVFTHTLVRDVAYAGLPKAERARRHALVAGWAAAEPGCPPVGWDAFVASHAERALELAGQMRLAADDPAWSARGAGFAALCRLARLALDRGDHTRADDLYGRAIAVGADDPDGRTRAVVGRAAARAGLRQADEAAADATSGLQADDPVLRAGALVVLGRARHQQGDDDAATAALVSALATASQVGADRVTGEALRQLGLIDYLAGRLGQAEDRFRAALELAERIDDPHGAGWALQHLTWSATTRGDYRTAERMLARAADVFGGLDDAGGLSWCAGTEAFLRLLQGRIREARDLARGLLPLGEAMGERWGVAACLTIDAFAAAELGELTTAVAEAETALDCFRTLGDTWGQAMALIAAAFADRGAGRWQTAVQRLRQAVSVCELGGHPVAGALAQCGIGYCQLDGGRPEEARRAAESAIAVLARQDLEPSALVGPRVLLGQALRAGGRRGQAIGLLEAAADAADETSLFFPRRQALAHWAGALLEGGELTVALAAAQRAMAVPAEDVRSRVVALRVLAGCLAACGDPTAARTALRQAAALAGATEQVSELDRTTRALAAVSGPGGRAGPGPAG